MSSDRDTHSDHSQTATFRDKLCVLSKWGLYSATALAIASVVLFILYVLLVNREAGVAGGLLIAAIVAIWAIVAVITLPVMAICQKKSTSAKPNGMNYLIAFTLALWGAAIGFSNGRHLYFTVKNWPFPGDWLIAFNSLCALSAGVLAIVTSVLLLLRNPRTPSFLLAILTLKLVEVAINILVVRGMHIIYFDIVSGIWLLPMAIVFSAYLFVRRQFEKRKEPSCG